MQSQRNKSGVSKARPPKANATESVRQAANAYIVSHYPFGWLGGTPRRLKLKHLGLWIVPVFLTSPGIGPVGEAGVVAVDDLTTKVVGATEQQEVTEMVRHLKESKADELEAAFLRARTV